MRNAKMLKFVPVHLKTERMCEHVHKKVPLVIRYVPDWLRLKKCLIQLF